LAEWSRLASAHDAEGLRRYLDHPDGPNPFASIREPGAYIQSLRDWTVHPLTLPGETKARFVTLTSSASCSGGLSADVDKIIFQGVPVDVEHGGVFALIDLPNDKHCAIGIGKSLVRVAGGKSRVIVFDETRRLLRARTEPVIRGELTSGVINSGP